MKRVWICSVGLSGLLALAGCGGGGADVAGTGDAEAETAAEAAIKRRAADSLPAIGEYLPPLDDGRIEVAPPEGWNVLSRKDKYLANFTKGKANEFPRISVTVAEAPPGADDYSEDNAFESAAATNKRHRAEAKKSIVEPAKPLVLGEHVWLRHVRNPRFSGEPIAIQSLQTIYGGRQYTVELIVDVKSPEEYAADLQKVRDLGYTVAAHVKFLKPGSNAPTLAP